MNCFQISIFAVANTTVATRVIVVPQLWIAFKLVSLQLQTQRVCHFCTKCVVVNCFQISIFAVANTTVPPTLETEDVLWIAFKLVSLQLQTQPDNRYLLNSSVVNCFQISIFAVANTTVMLCLTRVNLLWIAFKLVSLQLQTQPGSMLGLVRCCCELLSN